MEDCSESKLRRVQGKVVDKLTNTGKDERKWMLCVVVMPSQCLLRIPDSKL